MPHSHWNPSASSAGATGFHTEDDHQRHAATPAAPRRSFFYPRWAQKLQVASAQHSASSLNGILNMGLTADGTRIGYPAQLLGPEHIDRRDFNAGLQGIINGIFNQIKGGEQTFGDALERMVNVGRAGVQRHDERQARPRPQESRTGASHAPEEHAEDAIEEEAPPLPRRAGSTRSQRSDPSTAIHEEAVRAYAASGGSLEAWRRGLDIAEPPQEQPPPRTHATELSVVDDASEPPPALPPRPHAYQAAPIDTKEQEDALRAYNTLRGGGIRNSLALAGAQATSGHHTTSRNNLAGQSEHVREVHHHHGSATSGSADGDGDEEFDDDDGQQF
ncbi:hypothetical protein [Herbaspirillum hiltneri]|uniref:hypothetical protein n=1 Tax=Herbaspirillum hiltneri TaxID=341045 RepID=UPI00118751A7|nr:hypothetical protein [Herbaspirillum hiltneri]